MTLINPKLKNKMRPGLNVICLVNIIALLNKRAMSRLDIVEEIGICEATSTRWLNLLRDKNLIYVDHWRRIGGQPVAHWRFGYLIDSAPRPKPKTNAEICKLYRRRLAEQKEKQGEKINAKRKGINHATV